MGFIRNDLILMLLRVVDSCTFKAIHVGLVCGSQNNMY